MTGVGLSFPDRCRRSARAPGYRLTVTSGLPRDPLQSVEAHEVPVLAVGTGLWAAALVIVLVFRSRLPTDGPDRWLWICLVGIALGLAELAYTHARRVRLQRRSSPPQPPR